MRIPSGVADQYIYFVAVDATDFTTRETGLPDSTGFTVYRARNGGAPAEMTGATIAEVDATNMPGVYELLVDEDTTIDSGDDSQEMVFHITHLGMAPVTRTIEIYRRDFTAGSTLSVDSIADAVWEEPIAEHAASGGNMAEAIQDLPETTASAVWSESNVGYSGDSFGKTLKDTLEDTSQIGAAGAGLTAIPWNSAWDAEVQSECTDALNTYDPPTKAELDSGFAALNDISAAEVNTEVDNALAGYDGPTKAEMDAGLAALNDPTAAAIADAVWEEPIAEHAASGGNMAEAIQDLPVDVADAVWQEQISDHSGVSGSTAESLNAAGAAGDPWTTTLPGSYTGSQAGAMLNDILTDTAEIGAAGAGLTAIAWNAAWDAEVQSECADALLAYDAPTKAELDSGLAALNDLDAAGVRTAIGLATANLDTQLSTIDSNIDAVLVDTDTTIPGLIASLNDLDAAGVRTAIGLASADLDTQLAALPTATENADALLNRDMSAVSDTNSRSPLNAMRFLRNQWSVSGTTLTVTKEDDSTSAWTAVMTTDAAADPVVGVNPA